MSYICKIYNRMTSVTSNMSAYNPIYYISDSNLTISPNILWLNKMPCMIRNL